MSTLLIEPSTIPTRFDLPESIRFSDEDFAEICRRNPDRHIEQEAFGWLVLPAQREVHVYRPGQSAAEIHVGPMSLGADEGILPGFVLDLSLIW